MISTNPWVWVSAILTLCSFSLLYGDNKFFRFAEYTYTAVVVGHAVVFGLQTLAGRFQPLFSGQQPALSKQLTEVKWRIWLRKRYDGIAALNAAYGADFHTVNEVIFPPSWIEAATPLEKDAQALVAEVRREIETHYVEILLEAGWQIPIYPPSTEPPADLPAIQPYFPAEMEQLKKDLT